VNYRFKLIKTDSKDIMLQKISVSNKCCSFELSINERMLKNVKHIYFEH